MNFVGQTADGPIAGTGITSGSLPAAPAPAGGNRQTAIPAWSSDGFGPTGWMPGAAGTIPAGPTGSPSWGSTTGGLLGVLTGLIDQLGALVDGYAGESTAEGATNQHVIDGTFASTGDPHLGETASVLTAAGTTSSVNRTFDSMTGHDNLLSSQDFNGGYRLSTTVTAPNDSGVTMNAAATIHMNDGSDTIALRGDGSFTIAAAGQDVTLAGGQSVILGAGERVTNNGDGSLTVVATNAYGGAITTTLAAKGGGVDVNATVHDVNVGGDIASAVASPEPAAPTPPPAGDTAPRPGERRLLNSLDVSGSA